MDFVLVGDGRLAAECLRSASSSGMEMVAVATATPDVVNQAKSAKAVCLDLNRGGLKRLESMDFDLLFSVNNPLILRTRLLSRARVLSINYHDSPLPGYAGLYATSWALMNGEERHGISWHVMEQTIDTGDVLVERTFEVTESDTAFSLNLRCFQEALIGFEELVSLLKTGQVRGRSQDPKLGRYFGEKDIPFGAGLLDFSQPASKIERLSRALEFGPIFNPLCTLKVALTTADWLAVATARAIPGGPELGEGVVGSISADSWIVGTATEPVRLRAFRSSDGVEISAAVAASKAAITEGDRIPDNAFDLGLLTEMTGELKVHERSWRERLRSAARLEVPRGLERELDRGAGAAAIGADEVVPLDVSPSSEAEVIAAFAVVIADLFDVERLDLAFEDCRIFGARQGLDAFFSSFVPFRVDLTHRNMSAANWEEHVQAELDLCRRRGGFSRDLFLRDPMVKVRDRDFRIGVAMLEAGHEEPEPRWPRHLIRLVGTRREDGVANWHLRMSDELNSAQRGRIGHRISEVLGQFGLGETPSSVIPLTLDERQVISAFGTGASREYPLESGLEELVCRAMMKWPRSIAVVNGTDEISYSELDVKSSLVASGLISAGYGSDPFIGITTERSIEQIIGLLAIVKVGSGFVAIDSGLPAERQRLMASSTGIRVLLARDPLRDVELAGIEIRSISELTRAGASSDLHGAHSGQASDHAYVTFTSGSTGEPKAVHVRQRSLINFLFGAMGEVEIGPSDRRLQFSNLSFDVALEEIFCTLLSGASLVLRTDDCIGSTMRFTDFIEDSRITVLDLPTAFFEIWVAGLREHGRPLPAELQTVVVGGQALFRGVVDCWYDLVGSERISLFNCYGPAEATVAVTYVKISAGMQRVPIGKPLPNVIAIPFGRRGRPRPVGIVGEILLGGECLADGYLGRDELTRERFQDRLYWQRAWQKTRFYRTGDFGWYGPDGNLHFLGREDRQVKVRGFRIEIEAIEAELGRIEGVTSAAVFEDDGKLLGAVVSNSLRGDEVRSELASRLPHYMVPARIVVCDHFKTSRTGKVDWDWLKDEVAKECRAEARFDASEPRAGQLSWTAEAVLKAFADALNCRVVGLDDDFFENGGDSLGVVRVLGEIERSIGVRVPIAAFLGRPTPRGMVASIESIRGGTGLLRDGEVPTASRPATEKPAENSVASVFLVTPLGNAATPIMACMGWLRRPIFNLDIRVFEVSGEPVPDRTIEEIASRLVKELRDTRRGSGRLSLVGFSFGGLIACEMARQLEAEGETLDGLVLIDPSYPPVDLDFYRSDPRVRAFRAGSLERALEPPASRSALPGRVRHAFSLLRERVAVRTRLVWARLLWERALAGGEWRRRLSGDEELAWFLREVRIIERRSRLTSFNLSAPVIILLASDSYRDDVELRWRLLAGDDVELELLEGDHLGILSENVNDLGDRLRGVFDRLNRMRAES